MAATGFPSKDELQALATSFTEAVNEYDPEPAGLVNRMKLVGICNKLMRDLTDPSDMAGMHLANGNELVAIRTLLHLKALHAIPPPPSSISLAEISKATQAEEALLERLLRMLVCTLFLNQPSPNHYSHTKHSFAYIQMPGPGMFFQLAYDESYLMIDRLHLFVTRDGPPYLEPKDQRYSPYTWTSNAMGQTVWEVMAQNPERFYMFQAGLAHADASIPLIGYYDFSKLNTEGDRPVLADIGGGGGQSIVAIMKAHPELPPHKFILEDLKEPLAQAEASDYLPKAVVKVEHDFWTPQPDLLKGVKAYMVRRVMHDYSDPACIQILSHIRDVMAEDSVVLIADFVLPEQVTPADLPIATMDITIFNMAGKERSESGFKKILERAGLEFVTVHRGMGFGALVEGRLPRK